MKSIQCKNEELLNYFSNKIISMKRHFLKIERNGPTNNLSKIDFDYFSPNVLEYAQISKVHFI